MKTGWFKSVAVGMGMAGGLALSVEAGVYPVPTGQDETWYADGFVSLLVQLSDRSEYAPYTRFGVYDLGDPNNRVEIFDGKVDSVNSTRQLTIDLPSGEVRVGGALAGDFGDNLQPNTALLGFYLDRREYPRGGVFFYSESALNADGQDHLRTTALGSGWELVWEVSPLASPNQFIPDLVVRISPVPDSSHTWAILGGAAVGILLLRRKL